MAGTTYTDAHGTVWNIYDVTYRDRRGALMSIHLWATSQDDAVDRLAALAATGVVDGQVLETVEAGPECDKILGLHAAQRAAAVH